MEAVCAFLVLGCAFVLSWMAGSSTKHGSGPDHLVKNLVSSEGEGPRQLNRGLNGQKERKQELLRTVESEPDTVADTLKQWIRE